MQNSSKMLLSSVAYVWCIVLFLFSILNACLYHVDNDHFVEPEVVASEYPEQQFWRTQVSSNIFMSYVHMRTYFSHTTWYDQPKDD